MLHVNLKPRAISKPEPTALRITSTIGFYIAVSLCLSSFVSKPPVHKSDLINPLSQHAKNTAQELAPQFKNADLAINFFCNERVLGKAQSDAFKSSGTAHLLAISGGQVAFLAPVLSTILAKPLLILLATRLSPLTTMTILTRVKGAAEVLTAALCAAMFGSTGSLLRTTTGKLSSTLTHFTMLSHILFTSQTLASHKSFQRILVLCLLLPILGNPLQDLSFLFSALGASVLTLSGGTVQKLYGRRQFGGLLFQSLATTAITSGFISVVLCPIVNTNPLAAILANMVAIPLVTFWICPVSLLILLIPIPLLQHALIPVLDAGLTTLLACAQAFSNQNGASALPFFTAKHYLLFCVATCWAVEDLSSRRRPLLAEP